MLFLLFNHDWVKHGKIKLGEKEIGMKENRTSVRVVLAYRTIGKGDHTSHLRPTIITRRRHTILTSAYHCLEKTRRRKLKT